MVRSPAVLALALAAALAAAACASDDDRENLGAATYLDNARGYMEGGHYDQALAQYRRALQVNPSSRTALLGEATCLYWMGAGENPSAGPYLLDAEERFGALDPADFGESAWKVHLASGMVLARLGELWGRKEELARKTSEGGDPEAAARLREARQKRESYDARAEEEFRAVLAAEDQPFARNNLTALFSLASRSALRATDAPGYDEALSFFGRYMKEVEKSRDLWREMKKREPKLEAVYEAKIRGTQREEIELRDLIADIQFKRRDHEASVAELDRVLVLDPYRATAFFNRGRNQEELGRFGAAADDYRRFLKATDLPPGSAQVIEATERMQRCEERVREKMGQ